MDGKIPVTFVQGLLSGLGHPIIGIDHFAFIIAIGVAVGMAGLNLLFPVIFVAASVIGVALHVQGFSLPGVEVMVAMSVILIGGLIAARIRLPSAAWVILFALAGLFHGHAYGEGIYGAEPSPLGAYLAGLLAIQTVIAVAIALLIRRRADVLVPRLAGAVVAGIGLAILSGQILPG
jgi:urease accessory protein